MTQKNTIRLLDISVLAVPLVGLVVARAAAVRRRRADVQRLFAQAPEAAGQVYHKAELAGLPAPMQRYFRHVLRDQQLVPGMR